MKKILCVCYGGAHVASIAPLHAKLSEKYDVTILALTTAAHYLKTRSIPYVTFSDFPGLRREEALCWGRKLTEGHPTHPTISLDDSILYLGNSYCDLVTKWGNEKAYEMYTRYGRGSFLPTDSMRIIFAQLAPDLVITTGVARAEYAALLLADEHQIPSVCLTSHIFLPPKPQGRLNIVDLLERKAATKFCVSTEDIKSQIIRTIPACQDRVIVTGTPAFDYLKKLRSTRTPDKKRILYADWHYPYPSLLEGYTDERDSLRKELSRLAVEKKWDIIFRPHPSQKETYHQYKDITISSQDEKLEQLLASVDVVITAVSLVGIQGLIAGTGLVTIESTPYSKRFSYARSGLSKGIHHVGELEAAITQELNSVSKGYMLYDGLATENVYNEISSLLA